MHFLLFVLPFVSQLSQQSKAKQGYLKKIFETHTAFGPSPPILYAVRATFPTAKAAFSVNTEASSPYLLKLIRIRFGIHGNSLTCI